VRQLIARMEHGASSSSSRGASSPRGMLGQKDVAGAQTSLFKGGVLVYGWRVNGRRASAALRQRANA